LPLLLGVTYPLRHFPGVSGKGRAGGGLLNFDEEFGDLKQVEKESGELLRVLMAVCRHLRCRKPQ